MLKYNFEFEEETNMIPVRENQFDHYYSPANDLVERALRIEARDEEAIAQIDSIYSEAKPIVRMIERMETEKKKPHRDAIAKIGQAASQATDQLERAIAIAKQKASEYSEWVESKHQIEIETAAKSGDLMAIESPVMNATGSSIVSKTTRKFRVLDVRKIPHDFLQVNEKLINYTINNSDNVIPGIEIYEETKTSLRLKGKI